MPSDNTLLAHINAAREAAALSLLGHERMDDQRHTDTQTAIALALTSVDARLQQMNEFRAALADVHASSVGRAEYNAAHTSLQQQVDAVVIRLTTAEARTQGLAEQRQNQRLTNGQIIAILSVIVLFVGVVVSVIAIVTRR